jgi:hypothetical protein
MGSSGLWTWRRCHVPFRCRVVARDRAPAPRGPRSPRRESRSCDTCRHASCMHQPEPPADNASCASGTAAGARCSSWETSTRGLSTTATNRCCAPSRRSPSDDSRVCRLTLRDDTCPAAARPQAPHPTHPCVRPAPRPKAMSQSVRSQANACQVRLTLKELRRILLYAKRG